MSKKVIALIGHCGPDSSYLRMAIQKAVPNAQIVSADDDGELSRHLESGIDLALVNRQLDFGFDETEGVNLIRRLATPSAKVRYMLVSNYPDAQQAALQAGALPGFGKREIGSPRVTQLLREAVEDTSAV